MRIPRIVRVLALGPLVVVLALSGSASSIRASSNQACDTPTQEIHLYAAELDPGPDGKPRLGWGLSPDTASIPGPLIEMYEGECIAITVVNLVSAETLAELRDDPLVGSGHPDMPLGVSLHVHGVKYTTASDGTLHTDSWVPPGESRTYWWHAEPRVAVSGRVTSQGTAGYWWYHDHVVGTDHGTGGIASGLYGGLVVRRPGDIEPHRTFVVGMGPGTMINHAHYPDTERFAARQGERVEFLVIGLGDDFHTFHLHGHNWANNRTGLLQHLADETPLVDTRTIGPAESFGFQIVAGQGVGPGAWMLHCHVQFHSDHGMVTFLDVEPGAGPSVPLSSQTPHVHFGRSG